MEAETSPTRRRVKVNGEVTLWCNATGYPPPMVYWTRDDRHRKLQDGSHQYWVSQVLPVPSNSVLSQLVPRV